MEAAIVSHVWGPCTQREMGERGKKRVTEIEREKREKERDQHPLTVCMLLGVSKIKYRQKLKIKECRHVGEAGVRRWRGRGV